MSRAREAIAHGMRSAFLRDAGVLTLSGVVAAAISVAQGVLVARWLGPTSYGIVALVTAYPAIALSLLSPESPHATVRYLADREAAGDAEGALAVCKVAHLVDIGVATVALLVVMVSAGWAESHVVHFRGAAGLLILTAGAMAVASPGEAATAVLMHSGRYRLLAVERVSVTFLRASLVVALVAAGHGVSGAVVGAAAGVLLDGVALGGLAAWQARARWGGWWFGARTRVLQKRRGEMLRFMAWTDYGALLGTVTKQLDVVILGSLTGPTQVGYYRLARSISSLPGYIVGPLQAAVYPRVARLWALRDGPGLRTAVRRHASLGLATAATGLLMLPALGPLMRLLAGDQYGPAIVPAQILLGGALVWLALYWLRPLYMATGQVRVWVAISTVVVVATLLGFVPAAALWGAMGIATVQLVATVASHGLATARVPAMLASRLSLTSSDPVLGPAGT